jgi:hypothetical protein
MITEQQRLRGMSKFSISSNSSSHRDGLKRRKNDLGEHQHQKKPNRMFEMCVSLEKVMIRTVNRQLSFSVSMMNLLGLKKSSMRFFESQETARNCQLIPFSRWFIATFQEASSIM